LAKYDFSEDKINDSYDLYKKSQNKSNNVCEVMVFRTGFRSTKGQLVASLLEPQDNFLDFISETRRIICIMFIYASTVFFAYTYSILLKKNYPGFSIFLVYLIGITIAVPPSLTASLSVATAISISRLRQKRIFISESSRVNWSGLINFVCFDKTGTLTENTLTFKGVVVNSSLLCNTSSNNMYYVKRPERECENMAHASIELSEDSPDIPMMCWELMATCHNLALIEGVPMG
jgi:magnesium-transporting ATPase (P-type)